MILLLGHPAAVIDDARQHQPGLASSLLHPGRMRHLCERGRPPIAGPALGTLLGVQPDGGRRAAPCVLIVPPLVQGAMDGGDGAHARSHAEPPLRGVPPQRFEAADRLRGGEGPPLGAPACAAPRPRRGSPGVGPCPHEVARPVRPRGTAVPGETSVGRRRVKRLRKTLSPPPLRHAHGDAVDQLGEGAAEPVTFPHHQDSATAALGQEGVEHRPCGTGATADCLRDHGAAGVAEGIDLQRQARLGRTHPSVPPLHRHP
jgi:hypothetical protein